MNAFAVHFSFEFQAGLRNRALLLMSYLLPLGFYAMMGGIMSELNPFFREMMTPAMVVFTILSGTLLGLPGPLVGAREAGVFRSYKVNGVPAASILLIPVLTTAVHSAIAAAVIVVTAPVLFRAPVPVSWPGFVAAFLAATSASAGLGMVIAVISSSSRATILWSQMIYLPSMMLGGLMVPSSVLTGTLHQIGRLLPATYAMSVFQRLGQGSANPLDPVWAMVVLLSGAVVSFAIAIYLFNWDSHNNATRGHAAIAIFALVPYVAGALLLP